MTGGMATLARGDCSGILDPGRAIVRDSETWQALWLAHAGPGPDAPDVDFTTRMVAAAFAGERPTPGYAIQILESQRVGASLIVTVDEVHPPRGVIAAQIIVTPYHIVTLPRDDGEVRFTDRDGVPFRGEYPVQPQLSGASAATAIKGSPIVPVATAARSSTGLDPNLAAALAYLAGPFSGLLILLVERANDFVRFHAWQAIIGLGGLGLLSAGTLVFSFLTLILSPLAFTLMYRLSEILAVVWVVAWIVCLIKAFSGVRWQMPFVGRYAERLTTEKH